MVSKFIESGWDCPCLVIDKKSKEVILVNEIYEHTFVGTILYSDNEDFIGMYSTDWRIDSFKLFGGEIFLSN